MSYALLIDDDPQIIESAADLVRQQGLTLETASTWEEGLQKFHAYSPDLVVSDFNLPGSEMGLTLLLKMSRIRPSVKLILISAYLNEADVAQIKALNVVADVVRKTTPVETARRILAAVQLSSESAARPTDWIEFASAASRIHHVDDDAFAQLDRFLQSHRLPEGGARS